MSLAQIGRMTAQDTHVKRFADTRARDVEHRSAAICGIEESGCTLDGSCERESGVEKERNENHDGGIWTVTRVGRREAGYRQGSRQLI